MLSCKLLSVMHRKLGDYTLWNKTVSWLGDGTYVYSDAFSVKFQVYYIANLAATRYDYQESVMYPKTHEDGKSLHLLLL
jgi:hypothetical protein